VRVNVQLINTKNDQHIWSEIYDRDLTDVFAIQSDLAGEIASALQMKLSPGEKAQIARPPTANTEAYVIYLQARQLQRQNENMEALKQAEQLYERAIELDPKFALAFAHLSRLQSWIYQTQDPVPARRQRAREQDHLRSSAPVGSHRRQQPRSCLHQARHR
jgi:adenylate cyclase